MSDFDFLKEFAKGLDRERPQEPADADWEQLAASLDAQERGKRRRQRMLAWAFPLAASTAFVLLGTMLWQTHSRVDRMLAEIVRLQTELGAKNGLSLTDTTVQHIAVIQFDTIYRTVVMQPHATYPLKSNLLPNSLGQGADSIFQKKQSQQLVNINQKGTEGHSPNQNTRQETNTFPISTKTASEAAIQNTGVLTAEVVFKTSDSLASNRVPQDDLVKIEAGATTPEQTAIENRVAQKMDLSMLPMKRILPLKSQHRQRLLNAFDMAIIVPALVPPRVPLIRRLRPHDIMLGITGGLLLPQVRDAAPLNNYIVGLNGQIALGHHFRLLVGAEGGRTNFKVNGYALDNFNIPPPPTPPTTDDVFDYVQVEQPFWDFSMGLRYVFKPAQKIRPFVGATWVGEQTLEQTLKYEFENQVTGEEVYTLVPRNDARFNANGLQIGLGAEWAFTKRLSLGLEGMYQRQYGTTVPLLAERWGVKVGVAYSF